MVDGIGEQALCKQFENLKKLTLAQNYPLRKMSVLQLKFTLKYYLIKLTKLHIRRLLKRRENRVKAELDATKERERKKWEAQNKNYFVQMPKTLILEKVFISAGKANKYSWVDMSMSAGE